MLLKQPHPERSEIVARIRQEALRLFAERGFDRASMRDIAAAVGISPGNLTYHFPKKADLFAATIASAYSAFVAELRVLAATGGNTARDRLRAVMDRLNQLSLDEQFTLRVFFRELMTEPEHLRAFSEMIQTGHPLILAGAVQAALAEGTLPAGVGLGLVPMIMGTIVLAPVVMNVLDRAKVPPLHSSLMELMMAQGKKDLYTLLGFHNA